MPFMLYDTVQTRGGKNTYTKVQTVKIAGNKGPLFAIHEKKNPKKESPFKWHATADEIVRAISGQATQEILINLKPNVAKNVSLYRLVDVWGFSSKDWTPLALRLEVLFADLPHEDPERFMNSFEITEQKRDFVGEFLYVQGGTDRGTWNWGPVGSVNGALLWRPAFLYLSGELGRTL